MKEYFIKFSNGDFEFITARADNTAYKKACKMARQFGTKIMYFAESYDDMEEDRIIIKDGKEV